MAGPAIKVEGVGKRYRLGAGVGFERQISKSLDAAVRAPLRRLLHRGASGSEAEEFWALRDVSFEVPEGQVLGLIGVNGAGKSTLLKLLARITMPTEGRITLRGHVGSLLEVGTGFHPELTGRENVYLNGSILGMRRREIAARYDEIVEFSGIEHFMETPVKRYSSGMFVRLAFSVAAHLDPEILLMDEVLSVGDAGFQRKSLAKMESIAHSEGRTIIFVSHGMTSVKRLCDRVAVIEDGRLVADGPADRMIADYLHRVEPVPHGGVSTVADGESRVGSGEARIRSVSLLNDHDEPIEEVLFGQPFTVSMQVEVTRSAAAVVFLVGISSADGTRVLTANNTDGGGIDHPLTAGETVEVRARIEATLLPTEFVVDVGVIDSTGATIDLVERVISFTVRNVAADGSRDTYLWDTVVGQVRPESRWEVREPVGPELRKPEERLPR
jgi:lipopolysaccharide transport system ATP-binding protein